MKEKKVLDRKPAETPDDKIGDAYAMFDAPTLEVIATLLRAVAANEDGRIEARDRLMREAVEKYDASRRLH